MNYGFLTVRTNSARLPRKCFLPFGNHSVLEHVIERCRYYNIEPVITTTTNPDDDAIIEVAHKVNVSYFRGSEKNKLLRWFSTAKNFGILDFHSIDVDDPFFSGEMVLESLNLLRKESLDYVAPTVISSKGTGAVCYSIKTEYLEHVVSRISEHEDIEMIEIPLDQNGLAKKTQLVSQFVDYEGARLTLDYIEDYEILQIILKNLGPNCSRLDIVEFIKRNVEILEINQYRQVEWKNRQDSQIKATKRSI